MHQLARTNKDLEQFSYATSHDLRAPLKSIQGLSEALSEELELKNYAEVSDFNERINKRAAKMEQLVVAMYEYTKTGNKDFDVATINLEESLKELEKSGMLNFSDLNRFLLKKI